MKCLLNSRNDNFSNEKRNPCDIKEKAFGIF